MVSYNVSIILPLLLIPSWPWALPIDPFLGLWNRYLSLRCARQCPAATTLRGHDPDPHLRRGLWPQEGVNGYSPQEGINSKGMKFLYDTLFNALLSKNVRERFFIARGLAFAISP